MKKHFLGTLDKALTVIFIGGGALLLVVGVWLGVFAHDATTGIVLAVIGAALAGTPLSRMGSIGGRQRSERRLQMMYWRTGVKSPQDNPTGMQTTLDDD